MKLLSTKTPYECPLFRVEEREFEINGRFETHFIIVRLPNVMVVALTNDKKILLVKELIGEKDEILLGLPGGKLKSYEATEKDAVEQGLSELEEETNFTAKNIEFLHLNEIKSNWLERKHFHAVAWDLEPIQRKEEADDEGRITLFAQTIEEAERLLQESKMVNENEVIALKKGIEFFKKRGLI